MNKESTMKTKEIDGIGLFMEGYTELVVKFPGGDVTVTLSGTVTSPLKMTPYSGGQSATKTLSDSLVALFRKPP